MTSHVDVKIISWCRQHPAQWSEYFKRYWANASTWASDVRVGKFQYLGGQAEQWEVNYVPVVPLIIDDKGRKCYWVCLTYLGPRERIHQ